MIKRGFWSDKKYLIRSSRQRRCKKWYRKIYFNNLQIRKYFFRTGILYFVFAFCFFVGFFYVVFISNKSKSSFRFWSRKLILVQPTTLCLQLYVMICNSSLVVWRIAYKWILGLKREKTCKFFFWFPQKFSPIHIWAFKNV